MRTSVARVCAALPLWEKAPGNNYKHRHPPTEMFKQASSLMSSAYRAETSWAAPVLGSCVHAVVQAHRCLVRVDAHTAQPPRCHHLPRQILRFHRAAARAGKRRRPRRRSSRRNMLAALPQTLHGTIAAPVAELHCALPYCHGARSAPDFPATLPDDGRCNSRSLPFSPDPFSIAGVVFC